MTVFQLLWIIVSSCSDVTRVQFLINWSWSFALPIASCGWSPSACGDWVLSGRQAPAGPDWHAALAGVQRRGRKGASVGGHMRGRPQPSVFIPAWLAKYHCHIRMLSPGSWQQNPLWHLYLTECNKVSMVLLFKDFTTPPLFDCSLESRKYAGNT